MKMGELVISRLSAEKTSEFVETATIQIRDNIPLKHSGSQPRSRLILSGTQLQPILQETSLAHQPQHPDAVPPKPRWTTACPSSDANITGEYHQVPAALRDVEIVE